MNLSAVQHKLESRTMVSENGVFVDRRELHTEVTIDDVNRVLELGRLLSSVLTEEELEELHQILNNRSDVRNMGNAGVT